MQDINLTDDSVVEEIQSKESIPTFNILLVSSIHENQDVYHVFYLTNIDGLTRQKFCPHCQQQAFDPKDNHFSRDYESHVSLCKINGGQIIKKVKLDEQPYPFCPNIYRNETYAYLLANEKEKQFKPTIYYITYDFETVERKVLKYYGKLSIVNEKKQEVIDEQGNKQIVCNSQWISELIPLSVASTIKLKWKDQYQQNNQYKQIETIIGPTVQKTIYFDLQNGSNFINQWLEQIFFEAQQVQTDNKYDNELIPYKQNVSIIGFNSSKFDQALFSKYLHCDRWIIKNYIGDFGKGKMITVENNQSHQQINFIDALNYTQPIDLESFARDFDNSDNQTKGLFPYERINFDNNDLRLSKQQLFPINAFASTLKNKQMSDDDYKIYLNDAINYKTGWDYLQHYNELDTQIMIQPLDNLIYWFYQYKVDILSFMSLAANANAIKYALAYKDFDIKTYYPSQQQSKSKPFILTEAYWNYKVIGYNRQDKIQHRRTNNNVNINDFNHYKNLFEHSTCSICDDKFTMNNKPTLDRNDNKLPHTKSNCQPCCIYCNRYKSDKDEKITGLFIQLRRYCNTNNLPQTIVNNDVYQLLRRNITGGLSNVIHRKNRAGIDTIKRYYYNAQNKTITVINTNHSISHICGVDFNSLYPSCFSSQYHTFNKYTNDIMYICGSVSGIIKDQNIARKIIESNDRFNAEGQLFIAQLKGHIDEKYINDFDNSPPIARNFTYTTDEKTIGKYMYDTMKQCGTKTDKQERKQTNLLSTHGQYMTFSSYYLWFLIDDCHFIINDIKQLITFNKHINFNIFANEFMNKRIEAIEQKNIGMEKFCKMILNASYGSDGMNTEKYNKIKQLSRDKTKEAYTKQSWMNDRKLAENLYVVQFSPKNCKYNTCLYVAYFTLDNAKYWYFNFIYNFMYKCLDMSKLHFIEGDTDSSYWAISGKQVKRVYQDGQCVNQQEYEDNLYQGFNYVIKDQQFYDTNAMYFFPTIKGDKFDEKKLLGLAFENEGDEMYTLASKNYYIHTFKRNSLVDVIKLKNVNLKQNNINKQDVIDNLDNGKITQGTNMRLGQINDQLQEGDVSKQYHMSKLLTTKNALTGIQNKMVVLKNSQSSLQFMEGLISQCYIDCQ